MIDDFLPYEEQDTLEKILAHHGLADEKLTRQLATFANWVRMAERARLVFSAEKPPFGLVLLSTMGVLTPSAPDGGSP